MLRLSRGQEAVLAELVEWWEDIWKEHIGSRAVFVAAPSGWGRSEVLGAFRAKIGGKKAYPTVCVPISAGTFHEEIALQAQMLQMSFAKARVRNRTAELLGVDRLGGAVQFGIGVGGLFVSSPFAAAAAMAAAGVAVGAAGRVWDETPAGKEGVVARVARAVAKLSVSVPVVVTLDDADKLDDGLAETLIGELIERHNGQVLVVANVVPGSALASSSAAWVRYGLAEGRVRLIDVDSTMESDERTTLAAELRPGLPEIASSRIGQRTRTFADVFKVIAHDRLGDLDNNDDDASILTTTDQVIDAQIEWPAPSTEAIAVSWAGGSLHPVQADRVLAVINAQRSDTDHYVVRSEFLVRLAGPPSPPLVAQVEILPTDKRCRMAAAVLDTTAGFMDDPTVSVMERVIAAQAAHHVRGDLDSGRRKPLLAVQCQVVEDLEALGELAAAYDIARSALAELAGSQGSNQSGPEHDKLVASALRLAQISGTRGDPVIDSAVAVAAKSGAATGLEARVWAVIDLLHRPGSQDAALTLLDRVTTELEAPQVPESLADRWRLLLASQAGKAAHLEAVQRLLDPMLAADSPERSDAAQHVLHTVGDRWADIRLQIAMLEAELITLPTDADAEERLRIHSALASAYRHIRDFLRALDHAQHELNLRNQIQGPDHPQTLAVRVNIAAWTGESGDPSEAVRLFRALLPDQERVLGSDHPDVLSTRANIAYWTGESGDAVEALRLSLDVLLDLERVLGPANESTLVNRGNIVRWTGMSGDYTEALRLSRDLLPEMEHVLGPFHTSTLALRVNTAYFTGENGNAARALRLYRELLPDQERVLGPTHVETLVTRGNIATWTGQTGKPAEALRLSKQLLPDQERVLGPDHPRTLTTRANVAFWTGKSGKPFEAWQLSRKVLHDQEKALGPTHPETLTTRGNLASWTAQCGNVEEAIRQYENMLPVMQRVFGPAHPRTHVVRNNIQWLKQQLRPDLRHWSSGTTL